MQEVLCCNARGIATRQSTGAQSKVSDVCGLKLDTVVMTNSGRQKVTHLYVRLKWMMLLVPDSSEILLVTRAEKLFSPDLCCEFLLGVSVLGSLAHICYF